MQCQSLISCPEKLADAKDALNGQIFSGPLAKHDAEQSLKSLAQADNYKVLKVRGSGGSLTALPIIETLLGDVSAYIPTNVISITDGQIYLEGNLFYAGIRPAINVGISVSRVGGDAQTKAMKQVAAKLRMDMAQFRELAAFAQFGSDLDKTTQATLNRGQRMQEILKQPQYAPLSLEEMITVIFAGGQGFADKVPVERMREWETALLRFMATNYPAIGRSIADEKRINDETRAALLKALEEFKATFVP